MVPRRWLSNPSPSLKRALRAYHKLVLKQVSPIPRCPVAARAKRLNATELDLLVAGYQAGATVYELAEQFHIHRNTIARRLKAQGVQLRNSTLTDSEQARAVELYATDLSTLQIGQQLGRNPSTIWHALKRAGVQLRDCQGREV